MKTLTRNDSNTLNHYDFYPTDTFSFRRYPILKECAGVS